MANLEEFVAAWAAARKIILVTDKPTPQMFNQLADAERALYEVAQNLKVPDAH